MGGAPSAAATGPDGCKGLQCQQRSCDGAGTTTVSGVVYDPAAKNPLYNVVVYVPNAAVAPLTQGASCDTCNALYTGDPIAATVTDAAGKFTLKNVPVGAQIPLVIQIGKWRKQMTLANVAPCQDNPQPDHSLTLPKNHGEGDIPNIAISTGSADSLECLLRRVGLDATEYQGGPGATGHVHIFTGGKGGLLDEASPNTSPAAPVSSAALWDSKDDLMNYDMVLMSCEGSETSHMNQQALFDYLSAGGRVFASHFHYAWFNTGPFGAANLASWLPHGATIGDTSAKPVTSFPKGQAFQEWLTNVGALTNGELPIKDARHDADVGPTNVASQPWIVADGDAGTQYFTFNTPLDAQPDAQCGRAVFSDLHVGAGSMDYADDLLIKVTPDGCSALDLSPQEKALEFMLFDLSSCVTPDNKPPPPPPGSPVK
jgi:hypothetical protein